jgi:hypothetical protein
MYYHFIYKTTCISGKYYIGRHSTKKLDDGYFGSGKWVRSLKDKTTLSREILEFCDSIEELKTKETLYLIENVGKEDCMNFYTNSGGFDFGDLNIARSEKERKKRSERIKGDKNPAKREEIRNKISLGNKGKIPHNKGKKASEEERKKISEARIGIKISKEGKEKLKKRFPGTTHPRGKLKETEILEIYRLSWETNMNQKEIAEMFNVKQANVSKIKLGQVWGKITNHKNKTLKKN